MDEQKKTDDKWGIILFFLGVVLIVAGIRLSFASPYDEINQVKVSSKDEAVALVQDRISYRFFYYPQWLIATWKTGEGDCTGRSIALSHILNRNGFDAEVVGGHATCNGERVKHEWVVSDGEILETTPECTNYKQWFTGVW